MLIKRFFDKLAREVGQVAELADQPGEEHV